MTGDEFGTRAKERNTNYSIMRLSFKQIRIEKYITPLASCYCQWKPDIYDPSRRYTPQEVCAKL